MKKTKMKISAAVIFMLAAFAVNHAESVMNVILYDTLGEERSLFKKLKTMKDNQLIILNLASSTCVPCEKELPALNAFAGSLNGKAELWIIYVGDAKGTVDRIKAKNKIPDKVIMLPDPFSTYGKKFNVNDPNSGLPRTFVINNQREIVYSTTGYNLEEFEKFKNFVTDFVK